MQDWNISYECRKVGSIGRFEHGGFQTTATTWKEAHDKIRQEFSAEYEFRFPHRASAKEGNYWELYAAAGDLDRWVKEFCEVFHGDLVTVRKEVIEPNLHRAVIVV